MFIISHHDIRFALTIIESLNPLSYGHLKHRTVIENVFYVASLVFVCLFISSLFYIPMLVGLESSVSSGLEKMETMGISYDATAKEPVYASFFGIAVFGIGGQQKSMISLDDEGISSKNVLCASISPLCNIFPDSVATKEDLKDLSDDKEALAGILRNLIVISLPGIFLIAMIFYTAKFLLVAAAAAIIGLFASRLLGVRINLNSSFAIGCYSSTVLVVPELLGDAIGIGFLGIHWLAFTAMFAAGILIGGKRSEVDKHGRGRDTENKQLGKGAA